MGNKISALEKENEQYKGKIDKITDDLNSLKKMFGDRS